MVEYIGGQRHFRKFRLKSLFSSDNLLIFAKSKSNFGYMSKEIQNRVTYMICCVSAFAGHFGLSFKQAFSYLKRFKGISFLDECYEAEHQLSISDAVSDLSIICHRNGGALI